MSSSRKTTLVGMDGDGGGGGVTFVVFFVFSKKPFLFVHFKRKEYKEHNPHESKFFRYRIDSFSEGAWCAGRQTESYKSKCVRPITLSM